MKKFYSVIEVAEILSISYRRVLDLIALGEIQAVRIGNLYRISPYSLDQFLKEKQVKSFWK